MICFLFVVDIVDHASPQRQKLFLRWILFNPLTWRLSFSAIHWHTLIMYIIGSFLHRVFYVQWVLKCRGSFFFFLMMWTKLFSLYSHVIHILSPRYSYHLSGKKRCRFLYIFSSAIKLFRCHMNNKITCSRFSSGYASAKSWLRDPLCIGFPYFTFYILFCNYEIQHILRR